MNAIKHAEATQIDISLAETENDLTLEVSDDGVGLLEHSEHEGLGLRLMAHGAALVGADFKVKRRGDGGTTVLCKVNLND
jgi:nitrate/nitrite-specific signal transduction histidine kinase